MLVLSRKVTESLMIGDEIEIFVESIKGKTVRLGIVAPRSVTVHRKEIFERIAEGRREDSSNANDRDHGGNGGNDRRGRDGV